MIKLVAIVVAVVALAVTAWLVTPKWLEARERATACQAIIDQVRRTIPNPGAATLPNCHAPEMADPNAGENFIFRDGTDRNTWHMIGVYHADESGDGDIGGTRFSGDAWRTLDGWEADVYIYQE